MSEKTVEDIDAISGTRNRERAFRHIARQLERELAEYHAKYDKLSRALELSATELTQAQARCADSERILKIISELEISEQGIYTNAGKVMRQMASNYFAKLEKDAELLRFVRKDNPVTVRMWQDLFDTALNGPR